MEPRQYLVADLNAPRYKVPKFDLIDCRNKKFFKDMKGAHPELEKYRDSDINKCIKLFNGCVTHEVISNRNGVKLSEGLGIIVAGACKVSAAAAKKNIDHVTSRKLGKEVLFTNAHTDGYVVKVKYSNVLDKHMFENHELWMFDPCRHLQRSVSAEFKNNNNKDYIVFTTKQHIAHLFRKTKVPKESVKTAERKKQRLDEHDEFAIE